MDLNSAQLLDLARIVDRRIALSKGGQIQYVVVGYSFRFICESPSQLHVCNTYRNILIILIMSDTGMNYHLSGILPDHNI